jgi:hypothetical protein
MNLTKCAARQSLSFLKEARVGLANNPSELYSFYNQGRLSILLFRQTPVSVIEPCTHVFSQLIGNKLLLGAYLFKCEL